MPSIAIMSIHTATPWFRQLPGGDGSAWKGYRFTLNKIDADCVLIAVYNEAASNFYCSLPKSRRLLITSEPPGMCSYGTDFANQFGEILGPVTVDGFEGFWNQTHPALPWFYGIEFHPGKQKVVLDYNGLKELKPDDKSNKITTIISGKTKLDKHRSRLDFAQKLKEALGENLQIYGRGFKEILDKEEAIAPYKYVLVLENNDIPHFWTEKLADAYLGWAFPIYSGCHNIGDYFPEDSFLAIDIENWEESIEKIRNLLEEDQWVKRMPAIIEARGRLMEEYNLFNVLAIRAKELEQKMEVKKLGKAEKIRPTFEFAPLPQRIRWHIRAKIMKPLRTKTRNFRRKIGNVLRNIFLSK